MFSFCCPCKKQPEQKNTIDEKLIEVNDNSPRRAIPSSKRLAMSESDKKIKSISNLSQKSLPLSHLQTSNNHYHKNIDHPMFLNNDHNADIGTQPYFDNKFQQSHPKSQSMTTKGQLYNLDHNIQIIYFDTKKQDQFCLRYLFSKKPNIQRESKSILNYVLSKRSSSQYPDETELVLVIPSKVLYETKHLHIPQHVHAIFTNMRRVQKNSSVSNSGQIIQIIDGDYGSIRTQAFDKIIVILQGEHDIKHVKKYCTQLCRQYTLQQFIKIWWVFPTFMGIQDISEIIKQILRKFLIKQRIQQAAKYMFYEIDLVNKELNLQPFVLVRNRRWRQSNNNNNSRNNNNNNFTGRTIMNNNNTITNNNNNNPNKSSSQQNSQSLFFLSSSSHIQKSLLTKDYETQIYLAMGLLMVEMNQNVMLLYKYFLENVLSEMKVIDYMKYRTLLQNQKQNFIKKVLFYNLLSEQSCKILQQNNKIIQHKYQNQQHRRLTIKPSIKKKFIAAFGFQDSVQTGENNTPIQHQWDDQLRLQDLQTRKGSWDKGSGDSDDNELNLIDQEEIENIVIQEIVFNENNMDDKQREQKNTNSQEVQSIQIHQQQSNNISNNNNNNNNNNTNNNNTNINNNNNNINNTNNNNNNNNNINNKNKSRRYVTNQVVFKQAQQQNKQDSIKQSLNDNQGELSIEIHQTQPSTKNIQNINLH